MLELIEHMTFSEGRVLAALILALAVTALWYWPKALSSTQQNRRLGQIAHVVRVMAIPVGLLAISTCFIELTHQGILFLILGMIAGVGFLGREVLTSGIAALALIIGRPFRLEDWIEVDGVYGRVQSMNLRSVRVRTLEGRTVTLPNNYLLSRPVARANRRSQAVMCMVDFFLPCDQDFGKAKKLVQEVAASSAYLYLGEPLQVLLREGPVPDGAERFALQITLKAYVLDGELQEPFKSDVTERAKKAFRDHGILTAGELEHREARRELDLA